jgi:hypothetical protein
MSSETLPILITIPEEEDTKGLFSREEPLVKQIPEDTLKENLRSLSQSVTAVFDDLQSVGGYTLDEIQLQVEISASGGVQLIGSAEAGGKGAITLTFRSTNDVQS